MRDIKLTDLECRLIDIMCQDKINNIIFKEKEKEPFDEYELALLQNISYKIMGE